MPNWLQERDSLYGRAKSFDASQAVDRYAQGAWGSISEGLQEELRQLEGSSVRAGRFDSGLFDADRGQLFTRATGQLSDAVARGALTASGQQLDANRDAYTLAGDAYAQEETDRREAAERKRRRRGGIGSAIGQILGGVGGFALGGPAGAVAGARIGGGLGGAIGGN